MWILPAVVLSIVGAEFAGYWVHTLLHSERVPLLSRAHMWHHLRDYSPGQNQRSGEYREGTRGRFALGGLGIEWLLPLLAVTVVWVLGLALLGVAWWLNLLSISVGIGWGALMFGYIHEHFHLSRSGYQDHPWLGRWFRRVRRLHDIHHHAVTADGRMPYNMGICFFWFDRLFGTYRRAVGGLSASGVEEARRRYQIEATA